MFHKIFKRLTFIFIGVSIWGCIKSEIINPEIPPEDNSGKRISRVEGDIPERILIVYAAGHNNLSGYIRQNLKDLKFGDIPKQAAKNDKVFIICRLPEGIGYNPTTPTYIINMYRSTNWQATFDTLKTFPSTVISSKETLNNTLTFIRDNYPAKSYGLLFSSHMTGWLPNGYYNNPNQYTSRSLFRKAFDEYPEIEGPITKSLGGDTERKGKNLISYELDLKDFANALPMKFSYILFDACFAGGVEVLYELKDKADMLGVSPAEVLAEGFNYRFLVTNLLNNAGANPEAVCRDYFEHYNNKEGAMRSATISLLKTSGAEKLAGICKTLAEKYKNELNNVEPNTIQRFYRYNRHWFYDLKDIFAKSGISEADLALLQEAIDGCVIYKAATPEFLLSNDGFKINTYSGMTMYLPNNGSAYLNKNYKDLKWNQATMIVSN